MFPTRNKSHILPGPRQPSSEESTHTTCSKNCYSHGRNPRLMVDAVRHAPRVTRGHAPVQRERVGVAESWFVTGGGEEGGRGFAFAEEMLAAATESLKGFHLFLADIFPA